MSWWMALALVIILTGGFVILSRLHLLRIALGFWASFAVGIGVLAAARARDGRALAPRADHAAPLLVGARHLARGPGLPLLHDHRPEDGTPRAARADRVRARARDARSAPDRADAHRVGEQGRAARRRSSIVCAAMPVLACVPRRTARLCESPLAAVVYPVGAARPSATAPATATAARALPPGALPPITILPSKGVQSQLTLPTAQADRARPRRDRPGAAARRDVTLRLEPGGGQEPPRRGRTARRRAPTG